MGGPRVQSPRSAKQSWARWNATPQPLEEATVGHYLERVNVCVTRTRNFEFSSPTHWSTRRTCPVRCLRNRCLSCSLLRCLLCTYVQGNALERLKLRIPDGGVQVGFAGPSCFPRQLPAHPSHFWLATLEHLASRRRPQQAQRGVGRCLPATQRLQLLGGGEGFCRYQPDSILRYRVDRRNMSASGKAAQAAIAAKANPRTIRRTSSRKGSRRAKKRRSTS